MFAIGALFLGSLLASTEANTQRVATWREDLAFMVRELAERQPEYLPILRSEAFRRAEAKLRTAIPSLTDLRVQMEFARLLALLHDGHTGIFPPWDRENGFHKLPILLWSGSDGMIVLATAPEYRPLIGSVITRMGSAGIASVTRAIEPLLPFDNDYGKASLMSAYLVVPEVLQALDFIPSATEVPIETRDATGKLTSMRVAAVGRRDKIDWTFNASPDALPLWLARRDEKYWLTTVDANRLLYVQFNSADISAGKPQEEFRSFCGRIAAEAQAKKPEKVVIDLRWNSGGNFERTRCILDAVIGTGLSDKRGRLFTITSPETFSAGVTHALRLEEYTSTLFVGEPTGGRPNYTGELRRFRLPNSRIEVRYSAAFHRLGDPADRRPAIMPDLRAPLSSSEYRSGIDPALRAIETYHERIPARVMLGDKIAKEGVDAAIEAYRSNERDHFNDFIFGDDELESAIGDLLAAGNTAAALKLSGLYTAESPWSASSWYALAEAMAAAGDKQGAAATYRKAFALDRRLTSALEQARELEKKQ